MEAAPPNCRVQELGCEGFSGAFEAVRCVAATDTEVGKFCRFHRSAVGATVSRFLRMPSKSKQLSSGVAAHVLSLRAAGLNDQNFEEQLTSPSIRVSFRWELQFSCSMILPPPAA